ncbi:hypothetical protein Tco_1193936 [Tanacetum coccineum]
MGNVKKSIAERTRHQRQYDRRVNKRLMQMQESKIDTGNAVDDDLVVTESSGTELEVQYDNSKSGNDIDVDDADIEPIYDEEPTTEVQLTAKCNIFAIGKQHTKQPEIINEGRVDSDLRWKSMGRIFKSVGLRWIPTGKLFDSCTSKDDSEPTHGLNVNIPNIHESKQTLDLSACTSINVQKEQGFDLSAELESLFDPLFNEYFNGENQVVSKSSAVTTADASVKRHTTRFNTSTSTLEQTVTAMETSIYAPVTRMASTAEKPYQEDSYEFYLDTGIYVFLINGEPWLLQPYLTK